MPPVAQIYRIQRSRRDQPTSTFERPSSNSEKISTRPGVSVGLSFLYDIYVRYYNANYKNTRCRVSLHACTAHYCHIVHKYNNNNVIYGPGQIWDPVCFYAAAGIGRERAGGAGFGGYTGRVYISGARSCIHIIFRSAPVRRAFARKIIFALLI